MKIKSKPAFITSFITSFITPFITTLIFSAIAVGCGSKARTNGQLSDLTVKSGPEIGVQLAAGFKSATINAKELLIPMGSGVSVKNEDTQQFEALNSKWLPSSSDVTLNGLNISAAPAAIPIHSIHKRESIAESALNGKEIHLADFTVQSDAGFILMLQEGKIATAEIIKQEITYSADQAGGIISKRKFTPESIDLNIYAKPTQNPLHFALIAKVNPQSVAQLKKNRTVLAKNNFDTSPVQLCGSYHYDSRLCKGNEFCGIIPTQDINCDLSSETCTPVYGPWAGSPQTHESLKKNPYVTCSYPQTKYRGSETRENTVETIALKIIPIWDQQSVQWVPVTKTKANRELLFQDLGIAPFEIPIQ
jgi:hypothetical protein